MTATPTMQHPILPPEAWPVVVELLDRLGEPWPVELAVHDLAVLFAEHAAGKRARPPGRPFLAKRWRRTEDFARQLLEAHQVRASAAPVQRQPDASTVTGEPGLTTDPRQSSASPTPAPRQVHATRELVHQPDTSRLTGQAGQAADLRQIRASGSPTTTTTYDDHSLIVTSVVEGVQGETARPPVGNHTPPVDNPELGAEARMFLATYTRWAKDPKAPKRWRTPAPEALAWFLAEIMGRPEVIEGINVLGTLERWRDWLDTRAEAAGKPGTADGAKFPDNWKNALRNWFSNARRFKPRTAPGAPAPTPRGAFRGRAAQPVLFRPTLPPGDPTDDFNAWKD